MLHVSCSEDMIQVSKVKYKMYLVLRMELINLVIRLSLNPHQADISESLIRWGGGAIMPHKGNWIYWPYFCILCNKNGIKGLWEHKGQP